MHVVHFSFHMLITSCILFHFRFRMKEVLPIEKSIFWSDLGIARKVYQRRAVLQHAQVAISTATENAEAPTHDDQNQNKMDENVEAPTYNDQNQNEMDDEAA